MPSGIAPAGNLKSHLPRISSGTPSGPAPVDDPDHPGIASSLLAIGSRMHEKHYNRARDHVAETKYHHALARERAKAVSLARRLLAERKKGES